MVYYQKSLEEDGAFPAETTVAVAPYKAPYPRHQDPKQITLKGQPRDVVEKGVNKLRTSVAQQVAGEFNRVYGKGWRSSTDAGALQGQFSARTASLFDERFKQLTHGR